MRVIPDRWACGQFDLDCDHLVWACCKRVRHHPGSHHYAECRHGDRGFAYEDALRAEVERLREALRTIQRALEDDRAAHVAEYERIQQQAYVGDFLPHDGLIYRCRHALNQEGEG